jgi:ATP-dependent exoDNAse (exonuclease V) alpha subunit
MSKDIDYVNGMGGRVVGVTQHGVVVRTDTNYTVTVYPWTDDKHNVYYPFRVAYATTLQKMQGATLDHMTLYMDAIGVQAAGYVALSRVRKDVDWQFVGHLEVSHFIRSKVY